MTGGPPTASDSRFLHHPVMVAEVVDHLATIPSGVFLDATVGGGGHARALLNARPDLALIGLDRDPSAVEAARAALVDRDATICQARFGQLADVLDAQGVSRLAGSLFDLGVSSAQLDRPNRGFSYRHDGPLDMRMDRAQPTSAHDVVNTWPTERLAGVLRAFGDERYAHRVAAAIVRARPIVGTAALADVVREAIPAPARRRGGHPAKRTFQAIRIAVNDELDQIEPALHAVIDRLVPEGRGVVLSYHSGEDRIVKQVLRRRAGLDDEARFRGLPRAAGQSPPAIELIPRGSRRPRAQEVADNPRASSARFRAFAKRGTQPDEHDREAA
ncbi:16S rRNA (cytosine(1402)-N(4))-methyltransferase RsmH [Candidatus Poriferisocius sp.]|uniref:16S rRNA (cytosine(1402)-N(4))-methyltransferase RsmH n=1 Tax=Candidatus Poriferisocius sp. TaxID=3101276 RepID=UPI003B5B609E